MYIVCVYMCVCVYVYIYNISIQEAPWAYLSPRLINVNVSCNVIFLFDGDNLDSPPALLLRLW
jgi:hypothetical protein